MQQLTLKRIALAIAALAVTASSASVSAQSSVTIYGRVVGAAGATG
jgi:predicted porin